MWRIYYLRISRRAKWLALIYVVMQPKYVTWILRTWVWCGVLVQCWDTFFQKQNVLLLNETVVLHLFFALQNKKQPNKYAPRMTSPFIYTVTSLNVFRLLTFQQTMTWIFHQLLLEIQISLTWFWNKHDSPMSEVIIYSCWVMAFFFFF